MQIVSAAADPFVFFVICVATTNGFGPNSTASMHLFQIPCHRIRLILLDSFSIRICMPGAPPAVPLAPSAEHPPAAAPVGSGLPFEQGRIGMPKVPRHLRRCTFCAANAVGDKRHMHCVFDCPHFQGLRQQHAEIVQSCGTMAASLFKPLCWPLSLSSRQHDSPHRPLLAVWTK